MKGRHTTIMADVSSHTEVKMGSERGFGLVFAVVFAIVGFWPLLWGHGTVRIWALVVAAVFFALAYLAPSVLKPLNRLWFLFGMLLSKIVSPIVMGIIFFGTVTPTGLLRRLRNPDPLHQKLDKSAKSYWVIRGSDQAVGSSMRKQY